MAGDCQPIVVMADDKGGQEKTEDATPKRLREARKKGQVSKSKDLTTVMILIVTFGTIAFTANYMMGELGGFLTYALTVPKDVASVFDGHMANLWKTGSLVFVRSISPILAAAFIAALLANFLQVGALFSMEPLKPQLKKLNAIEGLKNMLKMRTFIELGKNVIKITAILVLAYVSITRYLTPFLLTTSVPIHEGIKIGGLILFYFLMLVMIIFILVAIADVMLMNKEYKKNLKMTKDEVKREYKEDEGDPLIKGQRKQLHQEMAMSDVAQQVSKSDVVVTNPTHLAVAIKYSTEEMTAPQIMAKGQRLYAQMIRDMADEYEIPIVRNVPLAWALIELEIGDEVPETLYQAVAEILAFVYRMKAEREHATVQAARPR